MMKKYFTRTETAARMLLFPDAVWESVHVDQMPIDVRCTFNCLYGLTD